MADVVPGDVFGFLLAVAKENPVAVSLVPMGFGFLLLVAEMARTNIRKAAVQMIYGYLGIAGILVAGAFTFSYFERKDSRALAGIRHDASSILLQLRTKMTFRLKDDPTYLSVVDGIIATTQRICLDAGGYREQCIPPARPE